MNLIKIQFIKTLHNNIFKALILTLIGFNAVNLYNLINIYFSFDGSMSSYELYYQHITGGQYFIFPITFTILGSLICQEYKHDTIIFFKTCKYKPGFFLIVDYIISILLYSIVFVCNELILLILVSSYLKIDLYFGNFVSIITVILLINSFLASLAYFLSNFIKKQSIVIIVCFFLYVIVRNIISSFNNKIYFLFVPNLKYIFQNGLDINVSIYMFILSAFLIIVMLCSKSIFERKEFL